METENQIHSDVAFKFGQTSKSSPLYKIIGGFMLVAAVVLGSVEGFYALKEYRKTELLKLYDRFEATGGRSYEGFIMGVVYENEEKEKVSFVEIFRSDTPIYVNHPSIPETSLRSQEKLIEMSKTINEAMEKNETRYLRVDVTHYYNKTRNERVNVMMSAKIIPPVEPPKADMDTERTIFRHPDTYEVIPKYMYEEIMAERKEKEDLIAEVVNGLNSEPLSLSRYTQILKDKKSR